jgi:hypothetical protein
LRYVTFAVTFTFTLIRCLRLRCVVGYRVTLFGLLRVALLRCISFVAFVTFAVVICGCLLRSLRCCCGLVLCSCVTVVVWLPFTFGWFVYAVTFTVTLYVTFVTLFVCYVYVCCCVVVVTFVCTLLRCVYVDLFPLLPFTYIRCWFLFAVYLFVYLRCWLRCCCGCCLLRCWLVTFLFVVDWFPLVTRCFVVVDLFVTLRLRYTLYVAVVCVC